MKSIYIQRGDLKRILSGLVTATAHMARIAAVNAFAAGVVQGRLEALAEVAQAAGAKIDTAGAMDYIDRVRPGLLAPAPTPTPTTAELPAWLGQAIGERR